MGLYRRGDSPYWWMHLERLGRKPLQESTKVRHAAHSTKLERDQERLAYEIYVARLNDLARRRHDLPTDTTVSFRVQAAWYEAHNLPAHRGAEREREALPRLIAFFGNDDLQALTPDRVSEYVTTRTGVKPGTINREIDILKSIVKSAVPRHLKASPIAGLKRLRTVKIRKRVLTAKEEARLLAVLQPADRALYIVAVDTLARLSNVIHLTRQEHQGTELHLVDSKTGPYAVPLSRRAQLALISLVEDEKDPEHYFPRRRSVKQPRNGIRLMLKYACARADITYGRAAAGITWHTATRATGATRMLQAKVDPKTVQTIGHWASLEQMGEYLQTSTPLMRLAVNRIGRNVLTPGLRRKRKARSKDVKSA